MNKKELVKALMNRMQTFGYFPSFTNVKTFIQEYEKLVSSVEPQKPVVPQFVADLIEYAKDHDWDLEDTFQDIAGEADDSNIYQWYYTKSENMDTFARAWLDGYEVEKEKRYTVKVKVDLGQFLGRYYINDEKLTPQFTDSQLTGKCKLPTFTRKELEETGFGWVFDCEGVEVEEVE